MRLDHLLSKEHLASGSASLRGGWVGGVQDPCLGRMSRGGAQGWNVDYGALVGAGGLVRCFVVCLSSWGVGGGVVGRVAWCWFLGVVWCAVGS